MINDQNWSLLMTAFWEPCPGWMFKQEEVYKNWHLCHNFFVGLDGRQLGALDMCHGITTKWAWRWRNCNVSLTVKSTIVQPHVLGDFRKAHLYQHHNSLTGNIKEGSSDHVCVKLTQEEWLFRKLRFSSECGCIPKPLRCPHFNDTRLSRHLLKPDPSGPPLLKHAENRSTSPTKLFLCHAGHDLMINNQNWSLSMNAFWELCPGWMFKQEEVYKNWHLCHNFFWGLGGRQLGALDMCHGIKTKWIWLWRNYSVSLKVKNTIVRPHVLRDSERLICTTNKII